MKKRFFLLSGLGVLVRGVAGVWFYQSQSKSESGSGTYQQYACTDHLTLTAAFSPDWSSIRVSTTNGSVYTLTRTNPGDSAGARYENSSVVLTGTGNSIAFKEGDSIFSCSPVLSDGNIAPNFGSPPTNAGTNNSPMVSGQYLSGTLLLGFEETDTLGKYLVGFDGDLGGMTLYVYANDKGGVSNCTGQCAVNWPPYTIIDPRALRIIEVGITGHAGTITRADGSMQVTYNGKPLYFYKNDLKPGDTNGQNVGGAWSVAKL